MQRERRCYCCGAERLTSKVGAAARLVAEVSMAEGRPVEADAAIESSVAGVLRAGKISESVA